MEMRYDRGLRCGRGTLHCSRPEFAQVLLNWSTMPGVDGRQINRIVLKCPCIDAYNSVELFHISSKIHCLLLNREASGVGMRV